MLLPRGSRSGAYRPPEGIDLIRYVAHWSGQPVERTGRATLLVQHGRAAGVRRWAEEVTPGPDGDRVVLRFAESGWFAAWLVGYGSDVVVLDPPEVRDEVVARLRELAEVHRAPAAGTGAAPAAPAGVS